MTKAKRRATLSICGLGWLDETEVQDIPAIAKRPSRPAPNVMLQAADQHDEETGEIIEPVSGDAVDRPAPSQQERPEGAGLSVEDMGREAAQRGETVFKTFYKSRTKQEQAQLNAIGDELRGLMAEATA